MLRRYDVSFKLKAILVSGTEILKFGKEDPSRLASEVEKKTAENFGSWNQVSERFSQKVSLVLLGEIRARMEEIDNEVDEE